MPSMWPMLDAEHPHGGAGALQQEEREMMHGNDQPAEDRHAPVAVGQQKSEAHEHVEVQFGHAVGLLNEQRGKTHERRRHGEPGGEGSGPSPCHRQRNEREREAGDDPQHPLIVQRRQADREREVGKQQPRQHPVGAGTFVVKHPLGADVGFVDLRVAGVHARRRPIGTISRRTR